MQQVSEQMDERTNRVVGKARIYVGGEKHRSNAAYVAVGESRRCGIEVALASDVKSRTVTDQPSERALWVPPRLNRIKLPWRETGSKNI